MTRQRLAHYEIVEKLGHGGMGDVYRAFDNRLKRDVALKLLAVELGATTTSRERFLREARAAAKLEHPNIVPVYDAGDEDGQLYIAMQLVRGKTLRDEMNAGPILVERALSIAVDVANALAKAHREGIVHRDVKPENILLGDDGATKLADFGLAKLVHGHVGLGDEESTEIRDVTGEGKVLGTVAYMAPEQARGQPVDRRTDVFAFGVLLHELVAGNHPFRKSGGVETLSAILTDPAPRLVNETWLQPLIDRCLAKESEARPDSMDVVREALRRPRPSRWPYAIAASAAAIGAVVWLANRPDPPAAIGASGRPAVIALPFDDHTSQDDLAWLSLGVPNMMATDLAQSRDFDVVSDTRTRELLEQLGYADGDIPQEGLVRMAELTGAGAFIVGDIYRSGDTIRIDARLEDVGSGALLVAGSSEGPDVFPLVDALTAQFVSELTGGESASENRPVAEFTTTDPEAYRLYLEALQRNEFEARPFLERAIERDPGFILAYFRLSSAPTISSERRESYREYVVQNLDRLPERERLKIEAEYTRADDPERAAAILEELVDKYPDDARAFALLDFIYRLELQDPDKGEQTVRRGLEANPTSRLHDYLARWYLIPQARYLEALRHLNAVADANPGDSSNLDDIGRVYLAMGNIDEAVAAFEARQERSPESPGAYLNLARVNASGGRYKVALDWFERGKEFVDGLGTPSSEVYVRRDRMYHFAGRKEDALTELSERLADSDASGVTWMRSIARIQAAEIMLREERWEDALRYGEDGLRFAEATTRITAGAKRWYEMAAGLVAGTAALRAGQPGRAAARLDRLRELYETSPDEVRGRWWFHALAGEIALASKDPVAAEAAFRAGEPELKMPGHGFLAIEVWSSFSRDGVARAKRAQGDLDGAIDAYRELTTPSLTNKWVTWLDPLHVLELARLLERNGRADEARTEYDRFLEMWSEADAGLPELLEAQPRHRG